MTRYFMRDTPLRQMEQMMMTPPYFKPKGKGLYYPPITYKPSDLDCRYCLYHKHKYRCPLNRCSCLAERIEAGALALSDFVDDCFAKNHNAGLRTRLETCFRCQNGEFFLNSTHRNRWIRCRTYYPKLSNRNKAAIYLLATYEDIWKRVYWKYDSSGIDFASVSLSGIVPDLYCIFQAAKAISIGSKNITTTDLASPELVTDEAFQLIIGALLLAKYGDVILNLERKER